MIYGAWVEQEIDYYRRELETLEQEEDKESAAYLERRASLMQCKKMLEELAEPIEEDGA